jgi:anthranilate phosphoribosyltransferase
MSRLLGQIREIYNDPIFVRSSRRSIPTPFAESLRQRVRALAAEAEALLRVPQAESDNAHIDLAIWSGPPVIEAAPLAARRSVLLEGEPAPEDFARKLADIGKAGDGRKRLAKHIATAGAGIGHSRPLTESEAEDAFSIVLQGGADPVQVGALLGIIHFRGETAAELAGFVRASRNHVRASNPALKVVDLDWPSYISPKSRRMPWFLQAAMLVAQAGYGVLLHGLDGGDTARGMLVATAQALGIPVCKSAAEAGAAVAEQRIAYLPVAAVSSQIHRLLSLYGLFETRSPVNSVMPLLNPLDAPAIIMGVVRPAYRELHRDAGTILGCRNLTITGMSRDAAEATPFRSSTLFRTVEGRREELFLSGAVEPKAFPLAGMTSLEYWHAVWTGTVRDERATEIVITTASAALLTVMGAGADQYDHCRTRARELWLARHAGTRLHRVKRI